MSQYNYAIFHKGCLDGFSSFFIAYTTGKLSKDVEIYPDKPSTKRIPPNIKDKDIIIMDVAYNKNVLEEIFKLAKSVVFIDHHISIKEDVEQLYEKYNNKTNITIVYDESRSGSSLTWKFFFGRQKLPDFIRYVEDQDTGKWEYPETKPFIYALKAYYHLSTEGKSLNKWFRLLKKENVEDMIEKGNYMQDYNKHLVNINLPRHTLHRFPSQKIYNKGKNVFNIVGQYKVAVFCGLHCPSVTDLAIASFDRIECDFVMMWIYNLERKEYVFSLRSKNTDISKITRFFKGGGHKYAGAFSISSSEYTIDELFHGNPLKRNLLP
jgi:nanoRNase/pAp phosphatase (c-di-AMP/oligoRNAs hydrolase)